MFNRRIGQDIVYRSAAIAIIAVLIIGGGLFALLLTEDLAGGDNKRRFKLGYDDELSSIGRHFNAAIDAQEELRSQAQGLLNQQRQLLIGALEQWPTPVALIALDGSITASTMDKEVLDELLGERRWIQTEGRELMKVHVPGDEVPQTGIELSNGKTVQLRLMVAGKKRPVGWIASVE